MENNIKAKLSGIFSDKQLINVLLKDDRYLVNYDSTDLSIKQKRELEDAAYSSLKDLNLSGKKVLLMANSSNSRSTKEDKKEDKNNPVFIKKKIENVDKIIVVSSAKGGVGKSTLTVNLALSLSKLGKTVGLLDADIYGPSIPLMLNRKDAKPLVTEDNKIIPIKTYGVHIMSIGFFMDEADPVIWRGPILSGVLNQFMFDVQWPKIDYLLVDLPPGTGDVQLTMGQGLEIDEAVIVSTPQQVAINDTVKGLNMFKKLGIPIKGFVENMSYFICDSCKKEHYIFGTGGVERVSEELGVNFLGEIPLIKSIQTGADEGKPIMLSDLESDLTVQEKYLDIAKQIIE